MTWTAQEATHELLAVLPYLNRLVAVELRRTAGEETSMPQFRVLGLLATEPLTLSALSRKRRVTLQAAGELVQALVERGWIVREPDPADRRQALLHLTDQGWLHYEHAQEAMTQRLVPLLEQLNQDETQAVQMALPALRRVLSMTEEYPDDSARS